MRTMAHALRAEKRIVLVPSDRLGEAHPAPRILGLLRDWLVKRIGARFGWIHAEHFV